MTHPSRPGSYAPGSTAPATGAGSYGQGSLPPTGSGPDGFGETRFERSARSSGSAPYGSPQPLGTGSAGGALTSPVPPLATPDQATTAVPTLPPPTSPGGGAPPRPAKAARVRGPRRARLQLRHISPFTVLKFCSVLAVALFFVWLITIGILYEALNAAGVVKDINDSVTKINGPGSSDPVTASRVFAGATILGVINIVLFIALSTVGSVVYNLCADLVGGIEVTLSERDA